MKTFFPWLLKLNVLVLLTLSFGVASAQGLEEPSAVANVEVTALDGGARLTWDAATDDGVVVRYKVHYGVTSVTEQGDTYDQEVETLNDDTTYDVQNLINNDTYFFAVTAIDDQGLESELYSVEASATPTSLGGDGSPILINALHTAPNKVLVVMSEPVQIDHPTEAFELTEDFSGDTVAILNTLTNSQQLTLVVDPSALLGGNTYRVTATTGVTDLDGNPVSSGVVDSVEFIAQDDFITTPEPEEEEAPTEEEEEETLIEEEEFFPEPEEDPNDFGKFFLDDINDKNDTSDFLDGLLSPENPINNLDKESPSEEAVVLEPAEETSGLSSAPDQIPPQDARALAADTSNMTSGQVMVTWQAALDIDKDIKDQVLYTRVGLGAWDSGVSLGKDVTQTSVAVTPNQNYQLRLVTLDNTGNESFGAAFEFSTTLNQSGGGQGTVIALSIIAVLGFFFLFAGGRRS